LIHTITPLFAVLKTALFTEDTTSTIVRDVEEFTSEIVQRLLAHAGAVPAMETLLPGFQFRLNEVFEPAVTVEPDTLTVPEYAAICPRVGVKFQPPQNPLFGKQPVAESDPQATGNVPAGLPPPD
jgi:hypothetical protein